MLFSTRSFSHEKMLQVLDGYPKAKWRVYVEGRKYREEGDR